MQKQAPSVGRILVAVGFTLFFGVLVGLIVVFALHVHAATVLTFMNRRARTVEYQGPRQYLSANYASRTMRWSGPPRSWYSSTQSQGKRAASRRRTTTSVSHCAAGTTC